jgi:hypothetical protein
VDLSDARNLPPGKQLAAAAGALTKIDAAAPVLTNSIYRWGTTANPLPQDALPSRLRDTVDFASAVASAAWEIGRDLGIKDPYPAYRLRPVREWKTEDFAAGASTPLWGEVTGLAAGPGEYDVRFQLMDGRVGLDVHSVALFPSSHEDQQRPLSVDPWNWHVNAYADYWLALGENGHPNWKSGDPLFLKMNVSLPPSKAAAIPPTSHGVILMGKSWRGAGAGRPDAEGAPRPSR